MVKRIKSVMHKSCAEKTVNMVVFGTIVTALLVSIAPLI